MDPAVYNTAPTFETLKFFTSSFLQTDTIAITNNCIQIILINTVYVEMDQIIIFIINFTCYYLT